MTKFYCPNKSIYYFFQVNTNISTSFRQSMLISFWIDMTSLKLCKGDDKINYEKIQWFECEIIDVVRSSYI
jgi:hypothetical protein